MALLVVGGYRTKLFAAEAKKAEPTLDVRVWPDAGRLEDIRYVLAWAPPAGVIQSLPNLELIVSVGAGVDHLFRGGPLPKVPIVRFVDPDLTQRMTTYVTLHVLYHHRRMLELRDQQAARTWKEIHEPAAGDVRVGIMGLGVLGQDSARVLKAIGFTVRAWSRSARSMEGVQSFAGPEGLDAFLAGTDILVSLLPLTKDTRGLINRAFLKKLPRPSRLPNGPVLINAGRGGLQVEADILAALDAGEIAAASLDVFETEPLPASSPLWTHPRVLISPHIGAESSPIAIGRYAVRQIKALREGRPLENIVDPDRGY